MANTSESTSVRIVENSPDEHVFYSNIAAVRATPEEVIIHFGLREENPNVGRGVAKAIMSLPHAKRLVAAMAKTIDRYERMFGEVVVDGPARVTPEGREIVRKAREAGSEIDD